MPFVSGFWTSAPLFPKHSYFTLSFLLSGPKAYAHMKFGADMPFARGFEQATHTSSGEASFDEESDFQREGDFWRLRISVSDV